MLSISRLQQIIDLDNHHTTGLPSACELVSEEDVVVVTFLVAKVVELVVSIVDEAVHEAVAVLVVDKEAAPDGRGGFGS